MIQGSNEQDPTQESDNSPAQTAPVTAAIPDEATKAKCHCGEKPPRYKIALEILTLFFAIGSAVAAGVAVHYYNQQWQEMHKQTVIQRNVSVTTERAWLALSSGDVHVGAPNAHKLRLVVVDMQITNSGKTPAKQVFAEVVIDIVRNRVKWNAHYDGLPPTSQILNVILAGDSSKFSASLQHAAATGTEPTLFSEADWQQLVEGRDYIVVYARMTYRDSFGRWHWQHFCSWSAFAQGEFSAQNCTAYNDMDRIDLDDETTGHSPPSDPYLSEGEIRNFGPARTDEDKKQ